MGFTAKPDVDYEIPAYVDHLRSVMDALGVGRASVMGTSLGSWVAARLAADHPKLVDKLVFMSPAGRRGAGRVRPGRDPELPAVHRHPVDRVRRGAVWDGGSPG